MKVGITGHQNLNSAQMDWVKKELSTEISRMKIDGAYSSLAIGTDQLFAQIALENEIPLVAVIPCKNYERTFDAVGIKAYKDLLSRATSVIQLPFLGPSEEAFYEAGKVVLDKADILIAVWNDLPSKGLGGTADIVALAIDKKGRIVKMNPISKTKKYINYG